MIDWRNIGRQWRGGPLFHGTSREITDRVLPKATVLPGDLTDTRNPNRAYATTDEDTAWNFATWNNPGGLRTRVYTVSSGPNATSKFEDERSPGEVEADSFDVKDRIDIMPGRQGTLPLNWATPGMSPTRSDELNHPDWNDPSLSGKAKDLPRTRTTAGLKSERDWLKNIGKSDITKPRPPIPPAKKAVAGVKKGKK